MDSLEKIYYSLDIETSGFDPERCDILEVGFAGFAVKSGRLEVVETWSGLFSPNSQVSEQVLSLTGLRQDELSAAPSFSSAKDFLQHKLGQAVLVGHNVGFDIRFLLQAGLRLEGPNIDTMDLVQMLLPSHHSYNLENLTNLFGISHSHAHRALPDSLAVVSLLERLWQIYWSLSETTRNKVAVLASPGRATWLEIFGSQPAGSGSVLVSPTKQFRRPVTVGTELRDKTVYLAPPFFDPEEAAGRLCVSQKAPTVLVLPQKDQVMSLWRKGLARAVFSQKNRFDREKFAVCLRQPDTLEGYRNFLSKILVWQERNWQTEWLVDLNLSFSGGQYKDSVGGAPLPLQYEDQMICCDLPTFWQIKDEPALRDRHFVFFDPGGLEKAAVQSVARRYSWGYLNYLLRTIFDPETGIGRSEAQDAVKEAMAAGDLFFGLTGALLNRLQPGGGSVSLDERLKNSMEYSRISLAAEHFAQRVAVANEIINSPEIEAFTVGLPEFFREPSGMVSWVEFSQASCAFCSTPLNVSQLVEDALKNAARVSLVCPNIGNRVLNFQLARLGMAEYALDRWPAEPVSIRYGWRKIFKGFSAKLALDQGTAATAELLSGCLPAVAVVDSYRDSSVLAKNLSLRRGLAVMSESQKTGNNKLFRNFGIKSNACLAISGRAVLNYLKNQQGQADRLPAKALVVGPLDSLLHSNEPYEQALAKTYKNPDHEFWQLRFLQDFHNIIKFFHTPSLKKVIMQFSKKDLKYNAICQEYYKAVFEKLEP